MSKWDELSMAEKAEMMKVAVRQGITNLSDIKQRYNEFAEGGSTDADLVDWIIREEGFNKKPEDIGDGKITIGSGLTAKKWHDLYKKRGNKWSAADNRMAVTEEVANRRRWAEKNIPNWDTLPESSQKALLSYKYNYDFTRGNSPKLFAALKAGDLQEAARQMDATSKDPKFQKGLRDRRKREQNWFLSGVTPSTSQTSSILFEQPVSTFVYNPYVQQQEQTQVLPMMIPDENTYVTTHSISPSEQRKQQIQEAFEARNRFNTLMQMIGVENTAPPLFMPTNNTPLGILSQLTNTNANGGSIHIKPSHRGRLTELKKRTGKTEAELYNDGNPAHKKMVVFARNSRKWKHGLGGNLFDGGGNTQASDYRYIQNEEGQWSRVTNDDMGRVFQGLTVTPNRTKIKYVPERIDNSEQGIKQRENFFLYRDNEGNLRGEPGLEITSPEFEILGAAPLIKGAGKVVKKVIYNKINPLGEPVIPENYLTLKPRVISSNNRTIIKESPFLRWGNDERFAVQPSKETYDNIVAQLKEAKDYKSSSGYKNLVNRFTQESKAKGLNFNENLFDDGNSSLSKLTVSNREAGHLGEYYPTTNSIDLDLSQIENMPVPFHEGIHWQRVGSPADRIGPKFEKWLEARKAKAPNEMQLFEEFRNSPEYERYYQRRAADKAIQDKVNDALYPFADETLRNKGELQAYGLEAGKAIGIEPFSEYPGMPDALTAIEKARKYSSQLRDVKAGGEENVRRFWDILTGNYIPSVTVGTLGLKSYLNK